MKFNRFTFLFLLCGLSLAAAGVTLTVSSVQSTAWVIQWVPPVALRFWNVSFLAWLNVAALYLAAVGFIVLAGFVSEDQVHRQKPVKPGEFILLLLLLLWPFGRRR